MKKKCPYCGGKYSEDLPSCPYCGAIEYELVDEKPKPPPAPKPPPPPRPAPPPKPAPQPTYVSPPSASTGKHKFGNISCTIFLVIGVIIFIFLVIVGITGPEWLEPILGG